MDRVWTGGEGKEEDGMGRPNVKGLWGMETCDLIIKMIYK